MSAASISKMMMLLVSGLTPEIGWERAALGKCSCQCDPFSAAPARATQFSYKRLGREGSVLRFGGDEVRRYQFQEGDNWNSYYEPTREVAPKHPDSEADTSLSTIFAFVKAMQLLKEAGLVGNVRISRDDGVELYRPSILSSKCSTLCKETTQFGW